MRKAFFVNSNGKKEEVEIVSFTNHFGRFAGNYITVRFLEGFLKGVSCMTTQEQIVIE